MTPDLSSDVVIYNTWQYLIPDATIVPVWREPLSGSFFTWSPPDASATMTGLLNTTTQTIAGYKVFIDTASFPGSRVNRVAMEFRQ